MNKTDSAAGNAAQRRSNFGLEKRTLNPKLRNRQSGHRVATIPTAATLGGACEAVTF